MFETLRKDLLDHAATPRKGGTAIIWLDGHYEVIPEAYLTDASYSHRRECEVTMRNLDANDIEYLTDMPDEELEITLWQARLQQFDHTGRD